MLDEIASLARIDLALRHRSPLAGRVLLATVAAIGDSLAADAILVAMGEAVFPGTKGYVHFQFAGPAERDRVEGGAEPAAAAGGNQAVIAMTSGPALSRTGRANAPRSVAPRRSACDCGTGADLIRLG
jgi:hypothetical protein